MIRNSRSLNGRLIGFSTGCFYRRDNIINIYSAEVIRLIAGNSLSAIEIMCGHPEQVKLLPAMIPMLKGFKVKSVHLPVDICYINTSEIRLMLRAIADFYQAIGASLAIVHPDIVDDWSVFDACPMRLAVENMDDRKRSFRRPQEFVNFFQEHPDWQFVLDLNHCFANDTSLASVDEFMDLFDDRLAEIHLSGSGVNGYHKPLYITEQVELVKKIPAGNCPIIIESPFNDYVLGPEQELSFINFNF